MKYGWDVELKEAALREWREWCKEAEELDEVKIPRVLLDCDKVMRETTLLSRSVMPVKTPMAHVPT